MIHVTRSSAVLSCRVLKLVAIIYAMSTLPLSNASDAVDMETSSDKNKPVIKKSRSWTLFHRILSSSTSSKTNEKIDASSLEWTRRGTINLTIFDPKTASDEPVSLEILNDDDALSESFINDIRTLDSISNTTTWYQLKFVDDSKKSDAEAQLLSSVPSCSVLRSNFRDELLIQFQSARSSNIVSVTYIPYISRFAPKKCMDYVPIVAPSTATSNATSSNRTKYQFISKVTWETAVPGMVVGKPQLIDPITNLPVSASMKMKPPPGLQWFPNSIASSSRKSSPSGAGGGSAPDEEGPDEQAKPDHTPFGFFKRYYYIFIPLLLMNLINSMNPPPPPSSSQAEPASGATGTPGRAAAVVAGTVAAAETGSQVRNRRGKKD